jgi:hypothetical protein
MAIYWCLKGVSDGLCYWTVRNSEDEAWQAGYPKSAAGENEDAYRQRLQRVESEGDVTCVKVQLHETS